VPTSLIRLEAQLSKWSCNPDHFPLQVFLSAIGFACHVEFVYKIEDTQLHQFQQHKGFKIKRGHTTLTTTFLGNLSSFG